VVQRRLADILVIEYDALVRRRRTVLPETIDFALEAEAVVARVLAWDGRLGRVLLAIDFTSLSLMRN
jgi:hypothetical protein